MGLLDSLGGGNAQNSGGGMSPLTTLLLGVLAYRTYQGKGRLADMLHNAGVNLPGAAGGSAPQGNAGTSPPANGPLGMPANPGGGLGDLLRGGLGGLLGGGAAGGLLSGGLGELVRRFQQNGNGAAANSWVGSGANQVVSPQDVERGLGADTIKSLAEQAGMPREQVLSHLAAGLPDVVDKLTPQGRLPTEKEARWA